MDVFSGAVKRKRRTSSSARTASRGHRAELWRNMFVSSWNHVFFTRRVLKWWVALKFTAAVGRDTADWEKKKVHSRVVCLEDNALNTASLLIVASWIFAAEEKGYFHHDARLFVSLMGHTCAWQPPRHTHTHTLTLSMPAVYCASDQLMTCPADCAHYQLNQQGRAHVEIKS